MNSPRQTTRMPEMLGTPVPPSVVFHGTGLPFEVFAPNARGIFFAERYSAAAPYSRIHRGAKPRVVAAALAITHPWVQITYADDVPYSARIDQSVAAVVARGYDGIYVPEGRAWIAVHPDQVTIVESDVQRSAFVPHLQDAVDDAEVGFHFEEGGCWGMALALKAVLGGDLVLRDGFTHAYVRVGSDTFDWQGASTFAGGHVVGRVELLRAALDSGVSPGEVESDTDLAFSVIDRAFERKFEPNFEVEDALDRPHHNMPRG